MKNPDSKLIGILGTVIIHLIAAILFMSFKLQSLKKESADEFIIEFENIEEKEAEEELIELPASTLERILQGDEELLNIARNLANRPDVNIDPADYIDMVKEELINEGMLGADNYIDQQKTLSETEGDENLAFDESDEREAEDQASESQEMAANYQGPTRIYYDLPGRNHTYLPVPIYKCQGAGKVVLRIEVTQRGIVESAKVITAESSTSDPCLTETAVRTALISRFNSDISAPKTVTGTLTYHFVAQ